MEAKRGNPEQLRTGQVWPMHKGCCRLSDELKKTYREEIWEKWGSQSGRCINSSKEENSKGCIQLSWQRFPESAMSKSPVSMEE